MATLQRTLDGATTHNVYDVDPFQSASLEMNIPKVSELAALGESPFEADHRKMLPNMQVDRMTAMLDSHSISNSPIVRHNDQRTNDRYEQQLSIQQQQHHEPTHRPLLTVQTQGILPLTTKVDVAGHALPQSHLLTQQVGWPQLEQQRQMQSEQQRQMQPEQQKQLQPLNSHDEHRFYLEPRSLPQPTLPQQLKPTKHTPQQLASGSFAQLAANNVHNLTKSRSKSFTALAQSSSPIATMNAHHPSLYSQTPSSTSQPHHPASLERSSTMISGRFIRRAGVDPILPDRPLTTGRQKSSIALLLPSSAIPPRKDSTDFNLSNPLNRTETHSSEKMRSPDLIRGPDSLSHQFRPTQAHTMPFPRSAKQSLTRKHIRSPFSKEHNNVIFSGVLWKQSRSGKFQKRICRFDGGVFVLLSCKLCPTLPKGTPVHEFDPIESPLKSVNTEFASELKTAYPYGCPVPALTMNLIASPISRSNPSPNIQSRTYLAPKWIISTPNMQRISQCDPLSHTPTLTDSRTFTIHTTDSREYTLRANSISECKQWIFLLTKMIASQFSASSTLYRAGSHDPAEARLASATVPRNIQPDWRLWSSGSATQHQFSMMEAYSLRLENWKRFVYAMISQEADAAKRVMSVWCSANDKIQSSQGVIAEMPTAPVLVNSSQEDMNAAWTRSAENTERNNEHAVVSDTAYDSHPRTATNVPTGEIRDFSFSDEDDEFMNDAGFATHSQPYSTSTPHITAISTSSPDLLPMPSLPMSPLLNDIQPDTFGNRLWARDGRSLWKDAYNGNAKAEVLLSGITHVSNSEPFMDNASELSKSDAVTLAVTPSVHTSAVVRHHPHLMAVTSKIVHPQRVQSIRRSVVYNSTSNDSHSDGADVSNSDLGRTNTSRSKSGLAATDSGTTYESESDGVFIVETSDYEDSESDDEARFESALSDKNGRGEVLGINGMNHRFYNNRLVKGLTQFPSTSNPLSLDMTAADIGSGNVHDDDDNDGDDSERFASSSDNLTPKPRFKPRSTSLRRVYGLPSPRRESENAIPPLVSDEDTPKQTDTSCVSPAASISRPDYGELVKLERDLYNIERIPTAEMLLDAESSEILYGLKSGQGTPRSIPALPLLPIRPHTIMTPRSSSAVKPLNADPQCEVSPSESLHQVNDPLDFSNESHRTKAAKQSEGNKEDDSTQPSLEDVNHACSATLRLLGLLLNEFDTMEPFVIREFAGVSIPHHYTMLTSFSNTHLNDEVPDFQIRYPKHAVVIRERAELLCTALVEYDAIMRDWNSRITVPLLKGTGIDDAIDDSVIRLFRGEGVLDTLLVTSLQLIIKDIYSYFNS
ncbi:hypothetical protein BASA83_001025 [Batrachochytrium salamandrivorans]|nr:hypothetical protein BASA83_001025 [Batrachochytrium salamandrivorans]